MKAACSPEFTATLQRLGLTYLDWRTLCRRCYGYPRPKRTRLVRQRVKQVQRLHTGRGLWWRGQWINMETQG